LFLGSLLEIGEWEVLIFCVSYLGGAEVAAWGVMGILWEIFQAMTEGLGEAASVRVSYYLSEGLHHEARRLAYKVVFISIIVVVMVTSIFLMAAPNIAATISTDSTIQHIFVDLVGPTGLANISMTIAQIYWSLAGAQGRFGFASATILLCRWMVILPIASICIFAYRLDLMSVACAIAIGYSVAACALAYAVFSSDWEQLSYFLRDDGIAEGEINAPVEYNNDNGAGIVMEVDDEDDSSFDEDEDDSDDESMFEEGEDETESRPDEENNML
jgi:Na+-driven multidrug efflux pump